MTTTPDDSGNGDLEPPIPPGADGGAGMGEQGAPIGFTAEVGGAAGGSTDDADELEDVVLPASEEGPVPASERQESGEPDDRPGGGS